MDNLLLVAAMVLCVSGMAWLALAMDVHWKQVSTGAQPPQAVRGLRILGYAALAGSLACCLAVDHPSMASLVWIMLLAGSALTIAFTLSWRPHWLRVFAVPFASTN
jgi:hypothetical protein